LIGRDIASDAQGCHCVRRLKESELLSTEEGPRATMFDFHTAPPRGWFLIAGAMI
jgi:hypothetical protein